MPARHALHRPRSAARRVVAVFAASTAAVATALLTGQLPNGVAATAAPATAHRAAAASTAGTIGLPVAQMEKIIHVKGTVSSGVLDITVNRSDLHVTGHNGIPFRTGFQLQGEFTFQSLHGGSAMLNGDMAAKPNELQPLIDTMIRTGIVFQAEHQHLYDLSPMVWFVHFRGVGSPVKLARAVHSLILATSTPLPQAPPAHPTTPLPAEELGHILGGDASVGENGVVTVDVPRTDTIRLGGHVINPMLNVMTNIQFQPMGKNGHAVVVSDIGMTADEVMPVMRTLRAYGWLSECLYNQETDEYPQLYFDHFFKTGEAVALARQLRQALNHTNV